MVMLSCSFALAQSPVIPEVGDAVPREVRDMYDRGLQFLVRSQNQDGSWGSNDRWTSGPGSTGLAVLALLASGEDPNFGLYSASIRKALRNILSVQNATTGYFPNSMYHHGFAMLALAEAYGAVDDRDLWRGAPVKGKSIGQALELAVRLAITSQKKNPFGGWRYSPDAIDADTSVSGAVLVGLLAARNAGIEVPDDVIDRSIKYFTSMTSESGGVAYSGGFGDGFGESMARSSIATLTLAIAKRKDLPEFRSTLAYLVEKLEQDPQKTVYLEYTLYYQSQALFQGDVAAWEKWSKQLVRRLKSSQAPDGSFRSSFGATAGTSMSLLALALQFRFLSIYER
ncbi:terpene cyclase/mutase family protein [bacterium]|nr:terpene cyclase/mutase family protein [bacterium]